MVKDAAISVRVEPTLKENLERVAAEQRLTLAGYVEQILTVHSQPPEWRLDEPEVVHTAKSGSSIKLNVATGWPVAILTPARAEKLAMELLKCAAASKRIDKTPEFDVYKEAIRRPSRLLITKRGAGLPANFNSQHWTKLEPPAGVAPDIEFDVETAGFVVLTTNITYQPGQFIGGGVRS